MTASPWSRKNRLSFLVVHVSVTVLYSKTFFHQKAYTLSPTAAAIRPLDIDDALPFKLVNVSVTEIGAFVVHVFVMGSYISVFSVCHPKTYILPLTGTTACPARGVKPTPEIGAVCQVLRGGLMLGEEVTGAITFVREMKPLGQTNSCGGRLI